jgi:hypothetical protein
MLCTQTGIVTDDITLWTELPSLVNDSWQFPGKTDFSSYPDLIACQEVPVHQPTETLKGGDAIFCMLTVFPGT